MLSELDVVRLKADDTQAGVLTSFDGTIVDVLSENEFTVEFFDNDGNTILPALYKTYKADELIKVN